MTELTIVESLLAVRLDTLWESTLVAKFAKMGIFETVNSYLPSHISANAVRMVVESVLVVLDVNNAK